MSNKHEFKKAIIKQINELDYEESKKVLENVLYENDALLYLIKIKSQNNFR